MSPGGGGTDTSKCNISCAKLSSFDISSDGDEHSLTTSVRQDWSSFASCDGSRSVKSKVGPTGPRAHVPVSHRPSQPSARVASLPPALPATRFNCVPDSSPPCNGDELQSAALDGVAKDTAQTNQHFNRIIDYRCAECNLHEFARRCAKFHAIVQHRYSSISKSQKLLILQPLSEHSSGTFNIVDDQRNDIFVMISTIRHYRSATLFVIVRD